MRDILANHEIDKDDVLNTPESHEKSEVYWLAFENITEHMQI